MTIEACQKYNLELDTGLTFEDLGVSGFKGDHVQKGALGKFIQLVENGTIRPGSWLIVESLDRLGREDLQTATSRYLELLSNDITIYTCADDTVHKPNQQGSEAMTKLMYSIMVMSRANEESETKARRGKSNWKTKRELASKGNVITKMVPSWLTVVENDNGLSIEVVEEKAEIVKKIFEDTIKGLGAGKIANELNISNTPIISTRKDAGTWHESFVKKILNNKAVFGELQLYEGRGANRSPVGEPIESYYPVIVDKATFYRAENAIKARKVSSGAGRKGHKFSNLLQGLVKCKCGGTMRYTDKGNDKVYLVCSNKLTKANDCQSVYYRYDHTEAALMFAIQNHDKKGVVKKLSKEHAQLAKESEDKTLELKADIDNLQVKINNLVDVIAETGNKNLMQKLESLEEEKDKKQRQLSEVPAMPVEIPLTDKEALKLLSKVALGRGTYQERSEFNLYLKSIIGYIVFYDDKELAYIKYKNHNAIREDKVITMRSDDLITPIYPDDFKKQMMVDFIEDNDVYDYMVSLDEAWPKFVEYIKGEPKQSEL